LLEGLARPLGCGRQDGAQWINEPVRTVANDNAAIFLIVFVGRASFVLRLQ